GLTGKIARVDLPVYQSPDDPKQPVPDASFDAASMLLTNVDAAMIYSVDGGKSWNAISGDTVDLSQDTVTAEHGIQVKKLKDEIKTEDSDPQILVLTQKEQVSAPVLEYSAADSAAVTTIKGQEYAIKAKDDEKFGQWQTSGEFTGLTEGTEYEIVTRVSGSGLALASEPSIPVTFKAENVFEEIGTASELLAFAKKIDSGSTKACARLTKNIDMSGATWKQVATDEDKPYQGTIDGNGFAIKNITFGNNEMNDTGLFQYTKGATFKNLTVNMTVAGKIRTGGLVEYAVNNLFEDCHISGTVTSYYSNAGAYASYDESSTFRNCTNSAAVTLKQGSGNTGGFIGTASGTVMENCVNKGKVSCAIGNGAGFIGTVGGRMIGGKMQPYTGVKLTNCYNEAVITANETIGMPSGIAGGISSESEITNCYNTGHIIGGEKRAAGIVGSISESVIRGCYNTGIVEGAAETGGIVANAAFESQIIDSYNQGEILGSGKYIGGIAGNTETYTGYEGAKIIECYNEGKITGRTGSSFIGGLVGFSQSMSMERSYNKGEIAGPSDASGDLFVGGLVGQAAKSSIEDSYNTGGINCSGNCGGGIAGFLYNGTTIVGCYNTGIVNGNSYTGGIAGYSKTNNTISRCYNLAKVAATGKYVGGIAGYLTADGSITDSYNAGDTFSLALSGNDYAAGILGYLTLGTLDNNYFLETEEVNQGIEAVGGSAGGVDTVTNTSSKTAEEF
ncbi:GLUG motif-containing protein, partial [Lactonifactor longoviformis]